MSEHQPEDVAIRAVWLIGLGVAAVTAACVGIAWLLVVPPAAYSAVPPTTLEHELIETSHDGEAIRAAGERRLDTLGWVDRAAGTVRIPIEAAIDAVVADPSLIARRRAAEARR